MIETPVKMITNDNRETLKIYYDTDSESPRKDDNLGTMVCSHKRYTLGDEQFNSSDYEGWDDLYNHLVKENGEGTIILPVYMLDHSGIALSCHDFNDRWDSGQVGFIYISAEKIRKEYNVKEITEELKERIKGYLENEVKIYSQYMGSEVYRYEITDERGDVIDSCGSYYDIESILAETGFKEE